MKKKFYNIPIFLPELACPHRCVFCNQEKISNTSKIPSINDCKQIFDTYLSTISQEAHTTIAFFGGNFTGLSQELQIQYLEVAQPYLESGKVKGIRLSTRPDYISHANLKILKDYGVTNIELGAQSFDNKVLQKSNRGHTIEHIENASRMILEHGFTLGLQMMIGLPYDTKEKAIFTAKKIIDAGASETRIYPALVIANTMLATLYREGKYSPLSITQSVDWLKDIIPMFENANVKILRVGLHKSEELDDETNLLAGPYHPSLKELVRSEIYFEKILSIIENHQQKNITLKIPPSKINYAIGYKAYNLEKFKNLGYNLKFVQDKTVETIQIV